MNQEESVQQINAQSRSYYDSQGNQYEGSQYGDIWADFKSMDTLKPSTMWRRYRFYTKSVDDYRPLIFNPAYPWWCSGFGDDYAIIVAYLPDDENLKDYWDDAYNVEFTVEKEIIFSGRFPKPDYYKE